MNKRSSRKIKLAIFFDLTLQLVGYTIMLNREMLSKNIFLHIQVPPADFLISVPKVKILQWFRLDPIWPSLLLIRSKINVNKKG